MVSPPAEIAVIHFDTGASGTANLEGLSGGGLGSSGSTTNVVIGKAMREPPGEHDAYSLTAPQAAVKGKDTAALRFRDE